MSFVECERSGRVATLRLRRGKVNALNDALVEELHEALGALRAEERVGAILLTGAGHFFSFGFDIPEFLSFSREEFTAYLVRFTELYTDLFLCPKPVVAALNGHAIAGGCMLALACDVRVMVEGKAKIALNEIGFGSTVFAGSTEMLRFWVGSAAATKVLTSGRLYTAAEAKRIGLVQETSGESDLMALAARAAADLATKSPPAFAGIKRLLRSGVAQAMRDRERESLREFVDIWYSDATRARLQEIKIR
jgi:Delta3-Delta2-enoyl-CoA isomerase